MANQSTIAIQLTVDDKGSVTIKQFGTDAEKSLKGVESSADNTSSASTRLKETWTDLAVKGAAAWMAVSKAIAYMDEGAKALQVESSFKILAEASGAMADTMIANMKAATRETIDDSDLMQKAIKLLTLGYSTEEIERFSGVIITASQIAGTTAVEAYDRLSDAIANRMPKALVAMGAITKDQMKVVTDALASGMTQSDLLRLALTNLELKQMMLTGTNDAAAISMQRFHAQTSETSETIGKILIVALQKAYGVWQLFGVASLGASAGLYKFLETVAIVRAALSFGDISKGFDELAAHYKAMAESDFAAANKLADQALVNITGEAKAVTKATAQQIADKKKLRDFEEARAKWLADENMTEAERAAAKEKQIEDIKKALVKAAEEEKKAQEEAVKNWLEGAETVAKVAAETVKQNDEDLKFFEKMEADKVEALKKELEAWRKAGDTAVDAMKEEIAKGVDLSQKTLDRIEKRGEAEREIYRDLRGYEDQYFAASKTLIDSQADKYRQLGVDEVAIAAWVTVELEKEEIKKGKASKDFMDGVNAGYLEMKASAISFGTVGYETFRTFSTSSAAAFGSNFRDILKGDFTNLGEAWETVGNNMLTTFTDNLGKMASQKITDLMQPAWKAFSGMFTAAGSGIWDVLKSGYSSAVSAMGGTGILGYLSSGWNAFSSFFTAAGSGIWDTLKSGYSGVISTLGSTNIVSSTWKSWSDFAADVGKYFGGIWTGFTGLLGNMSSIDIKGWLRPAWDAFTGFFSNGSSGIWDTIKSGYNAVVSALAESDLTMNFVATVSGAWESILGLINKGWDLAASMDWGFYQGGMVPGYASGGDSPANDTVPALLSPGEYVVPRSAINSESLAYLEKLRRGGGRSYYAGGLVDAQRDYQLYFDTYKPGTTINWAGGTLRRDEGDKAYFKDYEHSRYISSQTALLDLYNWCTGIRKAFNESYGADAWGDYPDKWTGMLGDHKMPFKPTSRLDELFASMNVSTNDNGFSSIQGFQMLYDGLGERKGKYYLDRQEAETGIISPKYSVWEEQIADNLKRIYFYDGTTAESAISTDGGWWFNFLDRYGSQITMALAAAAITQGVGAGVGAAYGATAGAVAGGVTGGAMGYFTSGGNVWSGILGAIGGAVGGYYSGGGTDLSEILSDMAGTAQANKIIGAGGTLAEAGAAYDLGFQSMMMEQGIDQTIAFAKKYGTKYLTKWAIGEIGNLIEGPQEGGSASLNFEGESGGFSAAGPGMNQIAPKESSFSFSARNGLDYVPRDNFRINAHEGEAVLTKPQAEDWRGGKGGENTYIFNFTLNSTVTDTKTFKGFAKDIMREITHIESRQITVGAN